MNNEDFQQMISDYFQIAAQRHRDQMAQASDILAKITAVNSTIDAMKTKFDTAMETIPAGHAAILDTLSGPLDDLVTKITALGGEFEAKVKEVLPSPGATPPA